MTDKKTELYTKVFDILKNNINKYLPIDTEYSINEIHTYFEIALGKGCRNIFPHVIIKYCIWYMKHALENKKKVYVRMMLIQMIMYSFYII